MFLLLLAFSPAPLHKLRCNALKLERVIRNLHTCGEQSDTCILEAFIYSAAMAVD